MSLIAPMTFAILLLAFGIVSILEPRMVANVLIRPTRRRMDESESSIHRILVNVRAGGAVALLLGGGILIVALKVIASR